MVGDSAKDDVVCGNRAGAVTVLLDSEGRYSTPEGAAVLEVRGADLGQGVKRTCSQMNVPIPRILERPASAASSVVCHFQDSLY